MDLYGCYFEFGGISSKKYGLVLANADTDRYISLAGKIESNTFYNRLSNKLYLIRDDYSDSPIEFDAEVVREDGSTIEDSELREIQKWLFSYSRYRKLYITPEDTALTENEETINGKVKRLYLNCRFKNPEKMEYNNGIAGYKFTMECDSCMAWQDAIIETFNTRLATDTGVALSIDVDTDIDDYIYPKVTINIGSSGGDITVINNSDDAYRLTKFTGVPKNSSLVMKGELNYVSDDYYQYFSNPNFIRLLDGTNKITVAGNVESITFEWQNRRYL